MVQRSALGSTVNQETLLNKQLDSYLTFEYIVLLHLGHGGSLSVASSSLTSVPQNAHRYVPIPGFSPVLGIFLPLIFWWEWIVAVATFIPDSSIGTVN